MAAATIKYSYKFIRAESNVKCIRRVNAVVLRRAEECASPGGLSPFHCGNLAWRLRFLV